MNLVFLHGGPASGKLTTARAMGRRLGYPVFHNHLTVNMLTTVFPFGSEPFVRLREQIWLSVITDAARTGRSVIFTFAPESTVQFGFPDRLRAAVEDNGGRLCSVRLEVSERTQEARIANPSRVAVGKLADVELLRAGRKHHSPVEFPTAELTIDTDSSDPERSAETIIASFDLRPEQPVISFPEP
ncbi:shikimate kinase [Microlunatus sp. Gsoil 973]|nr:shikimate kinase [Microlunatus sp. Gsoil 973]